MVAITHTRDQIRVLDQRHQSQSAAARRSPTTETESREAVVLRC